MNIYQAMLLFGLSSIFFFIFETFHVFFETESRSGVRWLCSLGTVVIFAVLARVMDGEWLWSSPVLADGLRHIGGIIEGVFWVALFMTGVFFVGEFFVKLKKAFRKE